MRINPTVPTQFNTQRRPAQTQMMPTHDEVLGALRIAIDMLLQEPRISMYDLRARLRGRMYTELTITKALRQLSLMNQMKVPA